MNKINVLHVHIGMHMFEVHIPNLAENLYNAAVS